MRKLYIVGVAALSLLSTPAISADLTLDCTVKRTDADGSQYELVRKIEFTWEQNHYAVYDNYGSGFTFNTSYRFISADSSRINIRNDNNTLSYIDRRTGQYYFKNDNTGMIMRGTCQRGSEMGRAF